MRASTNASPMEADKLLGTDGRKGSTRLRICGLLKKLTRFTVPFLSLIALTFPILECFGSSNPFVWAKKIGGPGIDSAEGIVVDDAGNIYVTGTFQGTAAFDGVSITSSGEGDVFLAKYDSDSVLQWVRRAGGAGNGAGHAVAVDKDGNVCVAGTFHNTAVFGLFTVQTRSSVASFVAKFDERGNVLWVTKFDGAGWSSPESIAVDLAGNSFVTGSFGIHLQAGAFNIFSSTGSTDVFVVKLDPRGGVEWARGAGGKDQDIGSSIALDAMGNCYVVGLLDGASATFSGLTLTNVGGRDAFIAKYDSAGRIQWAQRMGGSLGTDITEVRGIAVTPTGILYVTGSFIGTSDLGGLKVSK